MSFTRKNIRNLLAVVILIGLGLTGSFSSRTFAQDTPTDRPFPAAATNAATAEAPTQRPFPGIVRATAVPMAAAAATSVPATTAVAETGKSTAEATAELTTGDALATASAAQATADSLQTENKSLQDQLAAAETDKGATLYAIVIVVIGLLLAFAVFFGLRRGGK